MSGLFDDPVAPTPRAKRRPAPAATRIDAPPATGRPSWLRLPWAEQWTIPIVAGVGIVTLVAMRALGGDAPAPIAVPQPAPPLVVASTQPAPTTSTTWFDPLGCADKRAGCVPLLPYPLTPEAERVIGLDRGTATHLDPASATEVASQLVAQWPADICRARVLREQSPDGSARLVVRVDGTPRGTPLVECGARS